MLIVAAFRAKQPRGIYASATPSVKFSWTGSFVVRIVEKGLQPIKKLHHFVPLATHFFNQPQPTVKRTYVKCYKKVREPTHLSANELNLRTIWSENVNYIELIVVT